MKVKLLGRPDCHLCEEFEQELLAHAGPGVFEIEHVNVDSRPEWKRRYGTKIPVLLDSNDLVVCQAPFDPRMILEYLRHTKFSNAKPKSSRASTA